MELSLIFEDNQTAHKDLTLRFAGQVYVCDTYWLLFDYDLLTECEGVDKIRLVLQNLLNQWPSAVENISDGGTVYLPYDFSDQYTAALRCSRSASEVKVCWGWSEIEGYMISPSAIGHYLNDLPDFHAEGPTVQVPLTELIEAVRNMVS